MTEDPRQAALEARIESIDQHGTRGMESVRAQLGGMQRDMGRLESGVDRLEVAIQTMQIQLAALKPRSPWPVFLAYAGAVIPMYALVVDLIARGFR